MATKENEAKKNFLKEYQALLRSEKHIQQEIEVIRSRYTGQAIQYSDMPKAHNSEHDLSDYAAEVDQLLRDLEAIRWQAINKYHWISASIQSMDDVRERDLLRMKYLQNMTWEQIAVEMHYDVRHIYRIHGNALQHLNVIECQ